MWNVSQQLIILNIPCSKHLSSPLIICLSIYVDFTLGWEVNYKKLYIEKCCCELSSVITVYLSLYSYLDTSITNNIFVLSIFLSYFIFLFILSIFLSFYLSLSFYSFFLSFYLSIFLSFYLSIFLYLFVYSFYLSIFPFILTIFYSSYL